MIVQIEVGEFGFTGVMEIALAPKTCAAFEACLPFIGQLVQARWSGESGWVPLGDRDFGIEPENQTSTPAPGQILLYQGAVSETEILFPYGATVFASKYGPLSGNHFLTLTSGLEDLDEVGRALLHEGAQRFVISR